MKRLIKHLRSAFIWLIRWILIFVFSPILLICIIIDLLVAMVDYEAESILMDNFFKLIFKIK